jgi:hypothetical protein
MNLFGFLIGPCYGIKKKKLNLDLKLQLGAVDPDFPGFYATRIHNGDTVMVTRYSSDYTSLAVQPGVNARYYLHPRIVVLSYLNYFFIRPKREITYTLKLTNKKEEKSGSTEHAFISDIRFGFGIGYSLLK